MQVALSAQVLTANYVRKLAKNIWQQFNKKGMGKYICFMLAVVIGSMGMAKEPIRILDLSQWNKADLHDSVEVCRLWDVMHATATLQGIVNRRNPRLYIRYVVNHMGQNVDDYWWQKYRQAGEWLSNYDTLECRNLIDAVQAFRNEVRGLVVYDPKVAATSNVASTVAGVENLIAVRYDPSPQSLYSRLLASGLPVVCRLVNEDGSSLFTGKGLIADTQRPSSGSKKGDAYLWMIEHYLKPGRCNTRYAAYYIDQFWRTAPTRTISNHHQLTNHDFFVSKRAFFFDLSPWADEPATDMPSQPDTLDNYLLRTMLNQAYRQNRGHHFCYIGGFPCWAFKYTKHAGGCHADVATEWEFSRIISAYNAFKDADAIGLGALANASFWQHFPLKKHYPQHWVTRQELLQKGYLTSEGRVDTSRRYMLFYVGDYDASSWVAQTTPFLWDDPNRGRVPLMWSISPVLMERVPMALHNYRQTASPKDYFAAADNGAGYLMPGMLQEPRALSGYPDGLRAWAHHCRRYYRKWHLTISGFVIDGEAPALNQKGLDCYASFSPNGIVPQKIEGTDKLAVLHGKMPVLRSDWDIVDNDPVKATDVIMDRMALRKGFPFHWFRAILKSPTWYANVHDEVLRRDPNIVWLDAPSFFELLRIYLNDEQ